MATGNYTAGDVPVATDDNTIGRTPSTVWGRARWNDADQAALRTALGLGTAAYTASTAYDAAGAAATAVAAIPSDAAAGTSSLRKIGTGPLVAAAGNDTRFPRVRGTAALVGGSVVVTDAGVTTNSIIMLTPQGNGVGNGSVRVSARSAGANFTISSTNVLDDAVVGYVIYEP